LVVLAAIQWQEEEWRQWYISDLYLFAQRHTVVTHAAG
jgi:hypothetical protein